jgi:hypothetical protein
MALVPLLFRLGPEASSSCSDAFEIIHQIRVMIILDTRVEPFDRYDRRKRSRPVATRTARLPRPVSALLIVRLANGM